MLAEIETIAGEAGEIALLHQKALADLPVSAKGHLDLVTAADRDVERHIERRLRDVFPDDGIHGEEGASTRGRSGRVWVVDPIDGTFNFVRGGEQWAVSIGLYEGGRPRLGVLNVPARGWTLAGELEVDPVLNGTPLPALAPFAADRASVSVGFHPAIASQRRLDVLGALMSDPEVSFRCCGSAVISLISVLRGEVDAYLGLGESSWDVMAALPMLERLGAACTIDWDRTTLDSKLRFCVGKPEIVTRLEPLVADRDGALVRH